MKRSIPKAFRGSISQSSNAKESLKAIQQYFAKNEKAETSNHLTSLISITRSGLSMSSFHNVCKKRTRSKEIRQRVLTLHQALRITERIRLRMLQENTCRKRGGDLEAYVACDTAGKGGCPGRGVVGFAGGGDLGGEGFRGNGGGGDLEGGGGDPGVGAGNPSCEIGPSGICGCGSGTGSW
ncbi:hypothetical protein V2J09_022214 [Rumex salicifolius]